MKTQRRWFLVALLLVWQCLMPLKAQAGTFQWNVSGNGNWNVNGNWDNPGFPNASADEAKIGTLGGKDGTVTITGTSITLGALTLNSNADGVQISDGFSLLLPGALVNNNGTIKVGTGLPINTFLYSTSALPVTLAGNGKVTLGGSLTDQLRSSSGGGFINDTNHTINGGGTIAANITNKGNIIADNGTLMVTGNINNSGGTMSASGGSGNVLDLRSTITGGNVNLGTGSMLLNGANLDANLGGGSFTVQTNGNTLSGTSALALSINDGISLGTNRLVNDGTVTVGTGSNLGASLNATVFFGFLGGSGKVTLGGNLNDQLSGNFFNDSNHTIDGGGTIAGNISNFGNIVANHNTMRIIGAISGSGSIKAANTATLDLQGSVSSRSVSVADNAIFEAHNTVSTGNFFMDQNTTLLVSNNRTIEVKGPTNSSSFSFKQIDPSKWSWGDNSTLQMTNTFGSLDGAPVLEVGGEDFGYNPPLGFSNNFNLVNLSIGGTGFVGLQDAIDNGHRGGSGGSAEALYVESLFVGEGAVLTLNGFHLYVDGFGFVTPTDDWFNGHGQIVFAIPPIPLPSTLLMFGPGLLGLLGWRRLRKS